MLYKFILYDVSYGIGKMHTNAFASTCKRMLTFNDHTFDTEFDVGENIEQVLDSPVDLTHAQVFAR